MNKNHTSSFTSIVLLIGAVITPVTIANDCGSCSTSNGLSTSCSSSTNCNSGCSSCGNSSCNSCGSSGYSTSCTTGCATGCSTLLVTRDTHSNTAYRWLPFAYQEAECFNGGIALGYVFNQTFKSCDLATCMFGGNVLTFQGSQIASRSPGALLADQFGLSPLFNGSIKVSPQVRNNSLKFESYWSFDGLCYPGLYLRADLTFTNQQRQLFEDCNACLISTVTTNTPFPPGYMGQGSVTSAGSILQALGGGFTFGDMQTPLTFGTWNTCKQSDNKVAGFSIDLGWNFWKECDSHFGIFLRYEAPTGTNINGRQKAANNVFFPVIGNMHHNGFGGGLTAHKELWSNDCGDSISIYLDGYATHLFSNCQVRSFNLVSTSTTNSVPFVNCNTGCNASNGCNTNSCNTTCDVTPAPSLGCMSRYMLLKQMTPTTATGTTGSPLSYAFTGTLIPAINFSTRNVKSSIGATGEATLALLYQHQGFTLEVGYNIFGRQREKLCLRTGTVPCNTYNTNYSYALKGCTGDYCYTYNLNTGMLSGTSLNIASLVGPTLLNATATSAATICGCGTQDNPITTLTNTTACVDWTNAFVGSGAPANGLPTGANTNIIVAATSDPAIILSDANLDINSGRVARLLSNKGFVAMYYEWTECNWMPFLGFGGEVEGGNRCCDVKQWGAWLKGGFSF